MLGEEFPQAPKALPFTDLVPLENQPITLKNMAAPA